MDKLRKKALTVSRGYSYTYSTHFHGSSSSSSRGTILLLHGWPDTASIWSTFIADHLIPHDYNVIAPDCLGGSSRASSVSATTGARVSPAACTTSTLLVSAGPYFAPTPAPFDLDALIAVSQERLGYGAMWYWKLFTADDGAEVLNSHVEGIWTILRALPETWLDTLCGGENAVREFLLRGTAKKEKKKKKKKEKEKKKKKKKKKKEKKKKKKKIIKKTLELMPYATEERKQEFIDLVSKNGFEGPLRWYRGLTFGVQDEANKEAAENDTVVVGGDRDVRCRIEDLQAQIAAGLLPRADVRVLKGSGHRCTLSDPTGFGDAVLDWLDGLHG
ncbi:hypothetical protein PV08_00356 [Exophiala spinifera]|uniref:AB hydrolase-1 domain-containing protein n=1 Tax=Exophiala spinifera TaxID=91928 RepID=A0A0D1YWU4_9EURO|nr:uncharacterized protein PV08_00356 [Exophiala spinifera]KIW19781.1 hypothetical protein PV08_00356 [Exophiala spinifera]